MANITTRLQRLEAYKTGKLTFLGNPAKYSRLNRAITATKYEARLAFREVRHLQGQLQLASRIKAPLMSASSKETLEALMTAARTDVRIGFKSKTWYGKTGEYLVGSLRGARGYAVQAGGDMLAHIRGMMLNPLRFDIRYAYGFRHTEQLSLLESMVHGANTFVKSVVSAFALLP